MTHPSPKRLGAPKAVAPKPALRRFHQARWDEPVIFELSSPGQRGVLPPEPEAAIVQAAGDAFDNLPASLKRKTAPALPEMSQVHVLRHYLRLSQENLGVDLNIDVGQGTCTMKYSPKVNDQLARSHQLSELHPLQPLSTVQGILELMYRLEDMLKEISGLDRVTLQPGAGSAAIFANIAMIRAFHESRGEGRTRTEVITILVLSSFECRGGEGRGIQDHHAASGCRWLSRFRSVESRRLGQDRRAAHHQSGGHGHLQSAHRGIRRPCPPGRRPLLV